MRSRDGARSVGGRGGAAAVRRGRQRIPSAQNRGLWAIAWEVVREPMFLMLVAAGASTVDGRPGRRADAARVRVLRHGHHRRPGAAHGAGARRAARPFEPARLVVRDGVQRRIAGREVVRGDIVVVSEGDRVPADGLLRHARQPDGGRVAPDRRVGARSQARRRQHRRRMDRPGGDDLPSVFSGSSSQPARASPRSWPPGRPLELGRIGKAMQSLGTEPTPLQRETGRLVRTLAMVGLAACASSSCCSTA